MSNQDRDRDGQLDDETDLKTRRRLQRPPMYRVIFHNDDYTTRDFVVHVLMNYFHLTHAAATTLMLQIHTKGQAVAGVFPYDIAITKVRQVEKLAEKQRMPLKLSIEPDDGGGEEDEG